MIADTQALLLVLELGQKLNRLTWLNYLQKPNKLIKSPSKKILSGLVTILENLFVFVKTIKKISSNFWLQKKLLNDLTSAQTFKVCFKWQN